MSGFWSMVLSGCQTFVNWYWGGFDGLMSSLAIFVAVAHITDGMCAAVDRRPIGRAMIKDIYKSILIFILAGIGNILDANVLTSMPSLRTTIIFYYFSVEGLNILENTVHMGLPVPDKLREVLEQMHQS